MHAFDLDTFEKETTSVCVKRVLVKKLVTLDGKNVSWKQVTSWLRLPVPVACRCHGIGQTTISEKSTRVVSKQLSSMAKSIRKD